MDPKLKIKALKRLATTKNDLVGEALLKELEKISHTLLAEKEFLTLEAQLTLLECFAFRVAKKATSLLKNFLRRLEKISIKITPPPGYPKGYLDTFQNKNVLVARSLKILREVRYFESGEVFDTLLTYSKHENENVKTEAKNGLEALAKLNLYIIGLEKKEGIGLSPQKIILKKLQGMPDKKRQTFLIPILDVLKEILSAQIEGITSDYKKVTFTHAVVPTKPSFIKIRSDALSLLEELFHLASNYEEKVAVLNTFLAATRHPHQGDYDVETFEKMLVKNTLQVLSFFEQVAAGDDFEINKKIEHDAYWLDQHFSNPSVRKKAIEIRDKLRENYEYKVFKTLVGYRNISDTWSDEKPSDSKASTRYSELEKERKKKAEEFVESINSENYVIWKARIISCAKAEEADGATFFVFNHFLDHFGKVSPDLCLRFIKEFPQLLDRFLIPTFAGLWESREQKKTRKKLESLIQKGKYLWGIARLFVFLKSYDKDIIEKILEKANALNDINALNQILVVISFHAEGLNGEYVRKIFLSTIKSLTKLEDAGWIYDLWFRDKIKPLVTKLGEDQLGVILENLIFIKQVDYHIESILKPIAEVAPQEVVKFFGERIQVKKEKGRDFKYDAVPFELGDLKEPLSKIPKEAVEIVRTWFDGNFGMFIFEGGKFLQTIFPLWSDEFEKSLIEVFKRGAKDDHLFVLAVLRAYDGQEFLHSICKELVKILPEEHEYIGEVEVILYSTGVVMGEDGFVRAWRGKVDQLLDWEKDKDPKVKAFFQKFRNSMEKMIEHETANVEERVKLQKREWGVKE